MKRGLRIRLLIAASAAAIFAAAPVLCPTAYAGSTPAPSSQATPSTGAGTMMNGHGSMMNGGQMGGTMNGNNHGTMMNGNHGSMMNGNNHGSMMNGNHGSMMNGGSMMNTPAPPSSKNP